MLRLLIFLLFAFIAVTFAAAIIRKLFRSGGSPGERNVPGQKHSQEKDGKAIDAKFEEIN